MPTVVAGPPEEAENELSTLQTLCRGWCLPQYLAGLMQWLKNPSSLRLEHP